LEGRLRGNGWCLGRARNIGQGLSLALIGSDCDGRDYGSGLEVGSCHIDYGCGNCGAVLCSTW
jgi:hypothetical protein